ncbi:Lrp/AsnC family transcriptional regulator [Streptomyces sp. NPDC056296]|uniref:Lrp/AsnC family transcriptional regulator n=1 Tax=Streptomyces sp. NPDC056296 TaxID=3345775 RepID=UPI0035E22EBB
MSTEEDPGIVSAGRFAAHLDPIDRAIIAELQRDGRISVRALADQVHISRANAYTRISRMADDGLISGFTVRLDPAKAGLGTTAYVSVTIDQTAWRTVSAKLKEIPFVEHFALMGGDYDVLVLVRAPDNTALRHVVLERIQDIPGVRGSRTWLVFEEARGRGAPWESAGARDGDGA